MDRGLLDPKMRMEKLNEVLAKMPNQTGHPVRRGIKCPMAIRDTRGIQLISSSFKHTRIIVGLRHPVSLFESFYNYRSVSLDGILRFYAKRVEFTYSFFYIKSNRNVRQDED